MLAKKRVLIIGLQLLSLLLTLTASRALPAADATISGSYKIVEATDLGPNVRVTLDIRLINLTGNRFFVTKESVQQLPHAPQSGEEAATVILEPNGTSRFTQQFTIPQSEYEEWRKGMRLRVLLHVQSDSGETSVAVLLIRRPGGRAA